MGSGLDGLEAPFFECHWEIIKMDPSIDISIVIVSYNVKAYLEQSLSSIEKALQGLRSEIFVVDNGSTDGSPAMVRMRFPGVKLIVNPENKGFAFANNQALREVKGEVVCLINPDTLVREDTFRVCVDYLRAHPQVGMVGCKILNPDGSLQLACRRSFPTPWVAFTKISGLSALFPKSRLFGKYNLTFLDPEIETEVEAISGSFMCVRRSAMEQVGLLDPSFFLYGEDLDWCYRFHTAGWKIVYLPSTQIVHYKGRSTQEAPFDPLPVFYQAMHLFVKKHFHKWSVVPIWFIRLGIWIRTGISLVLRLLSRLIIPAVDVLAMQLALGLALWIRFGSLKHWHSYQIVDFLYSTIWLLSLDVLGCYKKGVLSSSKAASGAFLGLLLNTSLTFFLPQYAFSRKVVVIAGILNAVFLSGWRLLIRLASWIPHFPFLGGVGKMLLRRRAVVVGTGPDAVQLYNRLRHSLGTGFEMVGLVALNENELLLESNPRPPVLGLLDDLSRIAKTHHIQTVIFSPESVQYDRIVSTIARGANAFLDFKMAPRDLDVLIGSSSIVTLDEVPLVDLDYKLYRPFNRFLKRAFDLCVSILLFPLWGMSAILLFLHPKFKWRKIQIYSPSGEKFCIHQVVRKDATSVRGWKALVPLWWQVLLGKFSIVGMDYGISPVEATPMLCKPGLTGLVQVHRNDSLSESEKAHYRLYYLKNYSLLLDFEILLRAVFRL